MPDPRTPMASWASGVTNWNADLGGQYPPNYADFNIGGTTEEMDMIEFILSALLSDKGKGRYRDSLSQGIEAGKTPQPKPTPVPGAFGAGAKVVKGGGGRKKTFDEMQRELGIGN